MNKKISTKTLEVLSHLTKKDLTNGRFKIITRKNSHYLRDVSTKEELRITRFHNHIKEIMSFYKKNKLSPYFFQYLVEGGLRVKNELGAIPTYILDTFNDLEDFNFDGKDMVCSKNIEMIKKGFNLFINTFEDSKVVNKEEKLSRLLKEKNITLNEIIYHLYGFDKNDFDLEESILYIHHNSKIKEIREKLNTCNHEIRFKKFSYPENKYLLVTCEKCGLTIIFDLTNESFIPALYIEKTVISKVFLNNALDNIIKWIESDYFDKYSDFLNWFNSKDMEELNKLKIINKYYEVTLGDNPNKYSKRNDFYKLNISKDKNENLTISIFDKNFNFTNFFIDSNYEHLIKNIINIRCKELENKIKENIREENNKEKLDKIIKTYPRFTELDCGEYVNELIIVYDAIVSVYECLSHYEIKGYGIKKYTKFLYGSKEKDIQRKIFTNSFYFGKLKYLKQSKIEEFIRILIKLDMFENKLIYTNEFKYRIVLPSYRHEKRMNKFIEYNIRKENSIVNVFK